MDFQLIIQTVADAFIDPHLPEPSYTPHILSIKDQIMEYILGPILVTFTTTIMTAVGGWIGLQWLSFKKRFQLEDQATEALEAAVHMTWETLGKNLESVLKDGKLTEADRTLLQRNAIMMATDIAKRQGFDLLKVYTEEVILKKIRDIVKDRKAA